MKRKGFTLIESLVVLSIILILLSTISLSVLGVVSYQKEEIIKNELRLLSSAGKQYFYRYQEEGEVTQSTLIREKILSKEIIAKKGSYKVVIKNNMSIAYFEKYDGSIYKMKDGSYAKMEM